ncbi:DUF5590 domain-containing protein [Allobacillus sp. GCM10007491]|uniref:DUF5590 domain-containing protein n=1 Tax=Allobacillus saliphilus TaxID=2912308 RepID=A0A941CSX7_9BACI|nr:DUF5590 domain-containing protein [Allobacillus saliphilus]MBR7553227.1 DUF5590 domain-containing protein [Allobacillus saliphilus]
MQIKKRYILIGIVLLIVLSLVALFSILMITSYNTKSDHKDHIKQVAEIALKHSPIESVDESFEFNGESSYFVYLGENNEGKAFYVFVPKTEKVDDIKLLEQEDGLTKEEMLNQWSSQCTNCELVSISPGIIKGRFIWEIIYTTSEQYYFQNFYFSDGEIYDSISFKKE